MCMRYKSNVYVLIQTHLDTYRAWGGESPHLYICKKRRIWLSRSEFLLWKHRASVQICSIHGRSLSPQGVGAEQEDPGGSLANSSKHNGGTISQGINRKQKRTTLNVLLWSCTLGTCTCMCVHTYTWEVALSSASQDDYDDIKNTFLYVIRLSHHLYCYDTLEPQNKELLPPGGC